MTVDISFHEQICRIVARIPRGKVASYGLVAVLAGRPGAARAVGTAMRQVPVARKLPCHRIVKADGSLAPAGVFRGKQRQMLAKEGISFRKNGRIDMPRCEWRGFRIAVR